MNRYRAGGPSKATASTLCQKCLKRGHFSYECTASQQDRPYISRPSRTQQLANPKLAPKLLNTALQPEAEAPKTSASDIIKASAAARGRKGSFDDLDAPHKRSPSVSSHSSSDSISSISTNRSRSRSPPPRRSHESRSHHDSRDERRRVRSRSADWPTSSRKRGDRERGTFDREGSKTSLRRSRSPARRPRQRSPSIERPRRHERQRSRSRSPYRGSSGAHERERNDAPPARAPPTRERSLSPFSKRQALTMAQGGGR